MASADTPRFKLLTLEELDALPEPSWLIKDILPENALGVLFGLPGSKKTFVALSMALSIGAGHYWCGKTTKKGRVLYVAAEGLSGLRVRSRAYRQIHGIKTVEFRLLGEGLNLRNPDDLRQVRSCLQDEEFRPDLIVIDTLARSIPGADENSSQHMGEVICAVDELRRETLATVLFVHHTGKDGGAERGSSALPGAADVRIKSKIIPSNPLLVSLTCAKMKDAEEFQPATVTLERVTISSSASSLAVTTWRDEPEHKALHKNVISELLQTQFTSGATHKDLEDAFMRQTGQKESTFDRALRTAKKKGITKQVDGKYYAFDGT